MGDETARREMVAALLQLAERFETLGEKALLEGIATMPDRRVVGIALIVTAGHAFQAVGWTLREALGLVGAEADRAESGR